MYTQKYLSVVVRLPPGLISSPAPKDEVSIKRKKYGSKRWPKK